MSFGTGRRILRSPLCRSRIVFLIEQKCFFPASQMQINIRAFIIGQAPTTLVAVGYMQNGTVSLTQNFTQDHMAAAKALRLAQGYFGVEASPYVSLSEFSK